MLFSVFTKSSLYSKIFPTSFITHKWLQNNNTSNILLKATSNLAPPRSLNKTRTILVLASSLSPSQTWHLGALKATERQHQAKGRPCFKTRPVHLRVTSCRSGWGRGQEVETVSLVTPKMFIQWQNRKIVKQLVCVVSGARKPDRPCWLKRQNQWGGKL